jgi:hypothetical protein
MTNPFSPDTPPLLHVEPLPPSALAAGAARTTTDTGKPALEISVWLPGHWAVNDAYDNGRNSDGDEEEDFINDHCHGCDYNCDDQELDYHDCSGMEWEDSDGLTWRITSATAESPCPFGRGNPLSDVDFPCCAGHDGPCGGDSDFDGELVLGPTRFTAKRLLDADVFLTLPPRSEFTAVLQRLHVTPTGMLAVSNTRRLSNTYDPSNIVCWGSGNHIPRSLAEAADAYATSEANNDLLNVRTCARNCELAADDPANSPLNQLAIPLPSGDPIRSRFALLIADSRTMADAFLLLAASGATVQDGLAIAAAEWIEALPLPDGQLFSGWLSAPLAGGMSWLIGHSPNPVAHRPDLFVLLGQHNPNLTTSATSSSCDSPEPSSSAAAELADTLSRLSPAC